MDLITRSAISAGLSRETVGSAKNIRTQAGKPLLEEFAKESFVCILIPKMAYVAKELCWFIHVLENSL